MYNNLDKISQLPKFVTKEHYTDVRDSFNNSDCKYEDWYKGAIGFLASYNGRFFDGGYAGIVNTKAGTIRNYYDEAKKNLESQILLLNGIKWDCQDYLQTKNISNYLIYCDIPYKNTTKYSTSDFPYEEFYQWCIEMSKENIVLISEYDMPNEFEYIWEKEIKCTLDKNSRIDKTERLWRVNNNESK